MTCRLCDGRELKKVISLEPTPPANRFLEQGQLSQDEPVYPLDLHFCLSCNHIQMLDVLDPSLLFSEYVYVSGTSKVFVDHFEKYSVEIINANKLEKGSFIIDIGSNDGTFLNFFKNNGMRVLGIDPAIKISEYANKKGVETLTGFFSNEMAKDVKNIYGEAKIITANNVFAHSDNLREMIRGIKCLMGLNSLFYFEISYLLDVHEKILFDTIYHEHLSYHSVRPLIRFFSENGMTLIDVRRVDTHGGSLRGLAKLESGLFSTCDSVNQLESLEMERGLNLPETFEMFNHKIKQIGKEIKTLIAELKSQGKSIAGFGAPAKATTLMYNCGLDHNFVDYIVDDNKLKQGLYSPGFHVPILPTNEIYTRHPDYLVILAWNFAESIISRHRKYLSNGGHFIVPLPEVRVI